MRFSRWSEVPRSRKALAIILGAVLGIGFGVHHARRNPLEKPRTNVAASSANADVSAPGNPTPVQQVGVNNLAGSILINQHAAVSTGSTLTIPACGTGQYQYIEYIEIDLACNASLAAAATSTTTTTNLGGLQWVQSVPATAGSAGNPIVVTGPIKAPSANTAATIVLPAVTNCFTNANVAYYCDP